MNKNLGILKNKTDTPKVNDVSVSTDKQNKPMAILPS